MKRVLLTGGGGFIGRNLVNKLLSLGTYEIICLDQREITFLPKEVRCVQGSFGDVELLRRILPGVNVVVHLGSNALPANNDYVSDVEQNLLGSIALIKECENARVGKIVFASSGGTIYGPTASVPTLESEPKNPICSYGIIKVAVEHYLNLASQLTGIRTATLRIANPYGPFQDWNAQQGAVAVFCHKILTRGEIALFGDGKVSRDFVYIDDVVSAFLKAIESPLLTMSVNIGSGGCLSMLDLIRAIEKATGKEAIVQHFPTRGCDVPKSYLDIALAKQLLDWQPTIGFEEGIGKVVAWQKANPDAFN